jgi:glycerophosphoryl diester phosphodiesterase
MDYNTLRQIKRLNPDIYTVYTTTVGGGDLAKLTAANAFSVEQNFVSWGFVQYMKSANKGIFVWTVNDATTINKMIDLDVDAIISNDVSLCRSLMASNSGPRGVLQRIQRVFLNL